jgi:hypothetical protein
MSLTFDKFVRKPFVVDAVLITDENIEEIAPYIGTLERKPDGSAYILVDRRIIRNVPRVYPGYYMTKMGDRIRCYSAEVFVNQFVANDESIESWVQYMNDAPGATVYGDPNVLSYVSPEIDHT